MKINLFSIYDKKAQSFSEPFKDINDATAQRTMENLLRDKRADNLVAAHPLDYELHYFGEMDTDTGIVDQSQARKILDIIALSKQIENEDMFKGARK
jgi:hypothetical protein